MVPGYLLPLSTYLPKHLVNSLYAYYGTRIARISNRVHYIFIPKYIPTQKAVGMFKLENLI